MEESYIDLLENMNIDADGIRKIENHIRTYNLENVAYNQILKIKQLFGYCGCYAQMVGKIILDNLTLLQMSHWDIMKVAYVWDKTKTFPNMEQSRYTLRIGQLNRIYLRNEYLTKQLNRYPSYDSLISSEDKFVSNFSFDPYGKKFVPYYENLLNGYFKEEETIEEKEEKLSHIITSNALNWHRIKFLNERNKVNDTRKK